MALAKFVNAVKAAYIEVGYLSHIVNCYVSCNDAEQHSSCTALSWYIYMHMISC